MPAVIVIVPGPLQTFRIGPLEGWPAGGHTRVKRLQLITRHSEEGHSFTTTVQTASRSAEIDAMQASGFCSTGVPGETLRCFLLISEADGDVPHKVRSLLASGIEALIEEPW